LDHGLCLHLLVRSRGSPTRVVKPRCSPSSLVGVCAPRDLQLSYFLLAVRVVLGLFVCVSLIQFCRRLYTIFGRDVAVCVLLLTSTQFHFLFYASRPLPNTFALILGKVWCHHTVSIGRLFSVVRLQQLAWPEYSDICLVGCNGYCHF